MKREDELDARIAKHFQGVENRLAAFADQYQKDIRELKGQHQNSRVSIEPLSPEDEWGAWRTAAIRAEALLGL